jgi:hypothetical protein
MTNHPTHSSESIAPHPHARFCVTELVSSRYDVSNGEEVKVGHERPVLWDDRREGLDLVRAAHGEVVKLYSSYMQSPPKPGWNILLTGGDAVHGYTWTLYGITPHQ